MSEIDYRQAVALFVGGLLIGFLLTEAVHTWILLRIKRRGDKTIEEAINRNSKTVEEYREAKKK